jgi:carbon-monoxide dehydrogenase large subunit
MSGRFLGAAVTRLEDSRLLAGKGQYVDDINLPGMLHAAFVRASFAHGKVRGIDTGNAVTMPGVAAIYTMADFGDIASGPMPPMAPHPLLKTPITYHPLADTEICHVGEAVAIVLADNRANAEDAAAAVTLDIEYLPAVSDAALACEANSPKTHSKHASNILATMKAGFGDCARVFAKSDHVLTEHFDIHRGGCHSMECRGVVATIDLLTDALTISTSSQSP